MSDLEITQGDDRTLRFTVRDPADTDPDPLGEPVDLTGQTVRWRAKRHRTDAAPTILKVTGGSGVTILNQVTNKGQVDVALASGDTSGFAGSTVLLWELEVTDGSGKTQTVDDGLLLVNPQLG